jgi:hypothetical protein
VELLKAECEGQTEINEIMLYEQIKDKEGIPDLGHRYVHLITLILLFIEFSEQIVKLSRYRI